MFLHSCFALGDLEAAGRKCPLTQVGLTILRIDNSDVLTLKLTISYFHLNLYSIEHYLCHICVEISRIQHSTMNRFTEEAWLMMQMQ